MNLVRRVQTEYSSFIKDILYYIPLAETISSRKKLNYDQLMDSTSASVFGKVAVDKASYGTLSSEQAVNKRPEISDKYIFLIVAKL